MALAALMGCNGPQTEIKPALDVAHMDLSVKPGEDFFTYANGNWVKNTTIPEDKSRYGSFDILQEENNAVLKRIFEKASTMKKKPKGSSWQKVGDFYASGMDVEAIERKGLEPLKPELERIGSISSTSDLLNVIPSLHSIRVSPLFGIYAGQDRKNTTQIVLNLSQGGLGMPDRDYYLSDDNRSREIREAYQNHLEKTFMLLGASNDEAKQMASNVFALETRLAQVSYTRLERRDPNLTYNKVSLDEMQQLSPNLDWNSYFAGIGVDVPSELIIDNPAFFKEISAMIAEVPVNNWKDYFTWNLISRYSPYLSSAFVDQSFDFYGKVLSGNEVNKPRWECVAGAANMVLGEVVGQIFVEENFPPEAKEKMTELVTNLKVAFRERMQNLTWMSDQTKERALAKLEAINVKIGYPDKWKDYSDLDIVSDCYAQNIKNGLAFGFRQNMDKVGKPVDRTEWFMTPQTVNAYYSPTMNEIVFPAAILQPPFFNLNADDAVNYGAIGMVIAHEITHGFDDQGRKYNKEGNLEEWWEPQDSEKFNELTQTIIDQYEAFVAIDDMTLNGKLTLGENIADYGGLTISYHALQKSMEGKPRPEPIDGFTPEQRFFLSYSNVWRQIIRDKELMRRVKEDPHSPGKFRVNGAVFNINEFYDAFEINPTDLLYRAPEVRPTIW
jgi:putative endopeptidase